MMTKEHALELIARAREGFTVTSDTIIEIVTGKAWEPLGYADLTELWQSEFGDIPLASAVKVALVYAMIDNGADDDEIGDAVRGVGPETAASTLDDARQLQQTAQRRVEKWQAVAEFLRAEQEAEKQGAEDAKVERLAKVYMGAVYGPSAGESGVKIGVHVYAGIRAVLAALEDES